jgi:hypothetical protein
VSWESLLTRARNRRDRLETPSPALDMVVDAIDRLSRDKFPICHTISESLTEQYVRSLFGHALMVTYYARRLADETGLLRDRQLANDALSYALEVARRIVDQTKDR